MSALRELGKRVLPEPVIEAYRRRRALRHFLRTLGDELRVRGERLQVEELENKVLVKRPEITDRLLKDVLTRMDVLVQAVDRQVEALRARHGSELRELRAEVAALRDQVAALRRQAEEGERLEPSATE